MSSINPNNINGQYPVAGQDNDSQGFRDNFTNIKNNFTFTKAEIEDLQSKVLVTAPLDGFALNNDLNGTILRAPQLIEVTEKAVSLGGSGPAITVNWDEGHFQDFELDANTDLTFGNWPANDLGYAKLRLMINVSNVGTDNTVTFTDIANFVGLDNVVGGDSATKTINYSIGGRYIYEFSRLNAADIFVHQLAMESVEPPATAYLPQVIVANQGFSINDGGKHYYHPDNNANTLTITSHVNVALPIGTQITVVNGNAANITIDRAYYPANTAANITVTAVSITGNVLTVANTVGLVAGMRANTGFATMTEIYAVYSGNNAVAMSANATGTIANTAISFGNLSQVELYLAGSSANQNRVIGGYGEATLLKVANNRWHIKGTSIT